MIARSYHDRHHSWGEEERKSGGVPFDEGSDGADCHSDAAAGIRDRGGVDSPMADGDDRELPGVAEESEGADDAAALAMPPGRKHCWCRCRTRCKRKRWRG